MKCIRCGHDSKHKERFRGRCPQCKGEFAFEPQASAPVTDTLFANAIAAVWAPWLSMITLPIAAIAMACALSVVHETGHGTYLTGWRDQCATHRRG